ncbi:MAG: hypothetical protein ACXVZV_01135 [Terriglobales bacterium]
MAIALLLPTYQVIRPQRDINAEETVAANFLRLRHEARLPAIKRVEGNVFSQAACEAAGHGNPDKVWVENTNYAAMIYSATRVDDTQQIAAMATRALKADQRVVIGVCAANTPAFPSGRYWVALGLIGEVSERSVAELLSGRPVTTRLRAAASSQQQTGE